MERNPERVTAGDAPFGTLVVDVIDRQSRMPLRNHQTHFVLESLSGVRWGVDTRDIARFDSLAPGRYTLLTTPLGYNHRLDTISIVPATGQRLTLPISPAPVDACEGFGVVVQTKGLR